MPELGQWRAGAQTEPERSPMRSVSELPWLASSPDVHRDSALIDGVRYEDSIVLRQMSKAQSRSFVEVDLGRRYRQMTSVVGMLDDATEQFQVGVFRVYLDGHLWQEHEAALGKPRTVEVDVTGVLRLRLEMWRQGAWALATSGRSSRLAELAWGNPILF
jgi:NPCBM/NEW2 domain